MPGGASGPRASGIILAGGRATRMGRPKALLDLGGAAMIAHVARALGAACDEIVVVAPAPGVAGAASIDELAAALRPLQETAALDVRFAVDAAAGRGPVAGFAAGLGAARGEHGFVAACDTPFLAPEVVRGLLDRARAAVGADVVIARRGGFYEPMVAVYRVASMATHFSRQLAEGELRPTARFAERTIVDLDDAALAQLDPSGASFIGVNDADDYRRALARLAGAATPR